MGIPVLPDRLGPGRAFAPKHPKYNRGECREQVDSQHERHLPSGILLPREVASLAMAHQTLRSTVFSLVSAIAYRDRDPLTLSFREWVGTPS